MRDVVGSIFFRYVLKYLVAALIVEVDVDIGHVHALRIKEALEKEVVPDRVQLGDVEAVCYD